MLESYIKDIHGFDNPGILKQWNKSSVYKLNAWARDLEKPVLRIRIQGVKNQPRTAKKSLLLIKPKSELLKKERL